MPRISGFQTSKATGPTDATRLNAMHKTDNDSHVEAGFTLIELLVVLLVMGILMGTAVVSIDVGGDQRAFQAFGQRLIQRIELARDRAIQNNQEWGMRVEEDDYFFVAFDEDQRRWSAQLQYPFTADKPPRPVVFQLQVHDQFGVDPDEERSRPVTNKVTAQSPPIRLEHP